MAHLLHNSLIQSGLRKLCSSGASALLHQSMCGIEKESLRVDSVGRLSTQSHPQALGAALMHPSITTDYSEAQLELITPPLGSIPNALQRLRHLHQFVYANIEDELLWVNSMPCLLPEEKAIPIAQYGCSHRGRLKHLYRKGLSLRYGSPMQTISGIHYNYSFSETFWEAYLGLTSGTALFQEAKDAAYFGLIRNFLRYNWWLILLLGVSPALCSSFLKTKKADFLRPLGDNTLYAPFATSLRMSDLGYQNSEQSDLNVSYNSLHGYVKTLKQAMSTPSERFAKLGTSRYLGNGQVEHLQISENILQIENEFYGSIRPKCVPKPGQLPTDALLAEGVRYIEVRLIDLNPYFATGIDAQSLAVIESFLLFCLVIPSPPLNASDAATCQSRVKAVVEQGRAPGLQLPALPGEVDLLPGKCLMDQALVLTDHLQLLSEAVRSDAAGQALDATVAVDYDSIRRQFTQQLELPSARVIRQLHEQRLSFGEFSLQQSQQARADLQVCGQQQGMVQPWYQALVNVAKQSHQDQLKEEAVSAGSFSHYIDRFLKSYRVDTTNSVCS